jgi:hypothetical protein
LFFSLRFTAWVADTIAKSFESFIYVYLFLYIFNSKPAYKCQEFIYVVVEVFYIKNKIL